MACADVTMGAVQGGTILERLMSSTATTPAPSSVAPVFVNGDDAAKILCVSRRFLDKLVKAKEVPVARIGRCVRFRVVDLEKFAAERAAS
jgi:excisionase family DNA binding protein